MKRDRIIANTLVTEVSIITCKNMIVANNFVLSRYNGLFNILILMYLFVSLGVYVIKYNLKLNIKSVLILNSIILFWLFSYIDHGYIFSNDSVKLDITSFATYSLFALLIIPIIEDKTLILEELYRKGHLLFAFSIIGFVLFYHNGARDISGFSYSMTYGKNAVFACVVLFSKYKKQKHIRDLLFASIVMGEILLIGSRFPLLYILAYFAVWLLEIFIDKKKGLVYGFILLAVGIVVLLNYKSLSIMAYNFLASRGINVRTLSYLINNHIRLDSGRDFIHEQIQENLRKSPIWGFGMGGSEIILEGEAAHGFIYDSFALFGYVFGTLFLLISFLYIFVVMWKNRKNKNIIELFILLSCCFFPCITIQESVFSAYKFWWLIALCIGLKKSVLERKEYSL